MDRSKLRYFYLSHIYVSHPLILQKIISQAKVFTDIDPICEISNTAISNGFFTLSVQSDKPINMTAIKTFERITPFIEGVQFIFSQETVDTEGVGDGYLPTFVYTAYFSVNFGFFSFYFGKGLLYRIILKRLLEELNGGVYFLHVDRSEIAVVIESTEAFDSEELKQLLEKS